MLHLRIVDIAGGIRPLVRVRPRQRHVTHAQAVVVAQQMNVILDRVPALDSHQRGQFVLAVRAFDVRRRERHHHAVRMPRRLLVNRIDQIERVLGEMPLVGLRIHPDGKEFRAQISAPRLVQTDMANILRIR